MKQRIQLFLLLLVWGCGIITGCTDTNNSIDEYPVLVELISESGQVDSVEFQQFLSDYKIDRAQVYHWKNRWLIYDFQGDLVRFEGDLVEQFFDMEVQVFESPFYIFDRRYCGDEPAAGAWEHKILTANLVDDQEKQDEYMYYHETQFEKFPEVPTGFCRAEFQQLLLFRTGRQLMLVISYPAGKDYDELNSRTVDNTPRVDEWNTIMVEFQEGVQGTEDGETWVFFEPLN